MKRCSSAIAGRIGSQARSSLCSAMHEHDRLARSLLDVGHREAIDLDFFGRGAGRSGAGPGKGDERGGQEVSQAWAHG